MFVILNQNSVSVLTIMLSLLQKIRENVGVAIDQEEKLVASGTPSAAPTEKKKRKKREKKERTGIATRHAWVEHLKAWNADPANLKYKSLSLPERTKLAAKTYVKKGRSRGKKKKTEEVKEVEMKTEETEEKLDPVTTVKVEPTDDASGSETTEMDTE